MRGQLGSEPVKVRHVVAQDTLTLSRVEMGGLLRRSHPWLHGQVESLWGSR